MRCDNDASTSTMMAACWIRTLSLVVLLLVSLPLSAQASSDSGTLEPDFIDLVSRAMNCAYQVQTQDPDIIEGDFYIDGPHAALFSQQDEYCFLVFDSTHPDWADSWVNWEPFNSVICTMEGECCETRNGFKRGYDEPYYKDILESQVRTCKQQGNEVVIAGHSQGGGIAPVGAVALADTNPTVILFGAPGAINGDCPPLNLDKYHHFTNTIVTDGGSLRYDHVSSINWRSDQHGNLYVMGNDPNNIALYTHGQHPTHVMFDFRAHQRPRYETKIASLTSTMKAGKSIGTNGFDIGYACTRDDECRGSCFDGTCRSGAANGGACSSNADCLSERCEGYMWETGTCKPKLGPGEDCNESSDCISDSCPMGIWRKCS